jgi:hypothetical protein
MKRIANKRNSRGRRRRDSPERSAFAAQAPNLLHDLGQVSSQSFSIGSRGETFTVLAVEISGLSG